MQLYRFDLVFSYWILAFYILHVIGLVSSSPKLLLIIGMVENTFLLLSFIFQQKSAQRIASFIGINICIKVIPFVTVMHETIKWRHDLGLAIALYAVYVVYAELMQGADPWTMYEKTRDAVQQGVYDPGVNPAMTLLHDIQQFFTE